MQPRDDTIALTGSTGCLGSAFLEHALSHDPHLRAVLLVRPVVGPSTRRGIDRLTPLRRRFDSRIDLIPGDLTSRDASALTPLLTAGRGVFHFAACTNLTPDVEAVDRRTAAVNEGGTATLLTLLAQDDRPPPLFHISTAFVAGLRRGTIREDELDEGQAFRNGYEASKLRAEAAVRAAMGDGLSGAIFRPAVVVAPPTTGRAARDALDLCTAAVAAALRRGEPLTLRIAAGDQRGEQWGEESGLHAIGGAWCAAAIAWLGGLCGASEARVDGQTFHLTPHTITPLAAIFDEIRRRRPDLRITLLTDDAPGAPPDSPASRVLRRRLDPVRLYLDTGMSFDRTRTDAALPPTLRDQTLDLQTMVRDRLTAHGPV